MELISNGLGDVRHFFLETLWYWQPLYWLLAEYILVVWLVAVLLSRGLVAIQQGKPVEQSVHTAWGLAFVLHAALFVYQGADSVVPAFYGVRLEGDQRLAAGGMPIVVASLRTLPYVLVLIVDLLLAGMLLLGRRRKKKPVPVR